MPKTLLPIQYTPMAAGMMKQNQRLISGIIRFMVCIWLWAALSAPVWGFERFATFMPSQERPAEISGISARPMTAKLMAAVPAKISFIVSQGTLPRLMPRKLKSRLTSSLVERPRPCRCEIVSSQCSCMMLASLISK